MDRLGLNFNSDWLQYLIVLVVRHSVKQSLFISLFNARNTATHTNVTAG